MHERKPILARHSGIFSFLEFGFKLELHHNTWGYIAIFQQIFNANAMKDRCLYRKIYEISGDYKVNAKAVYDATFLLIDFP